MTLFNSNIKQAHKANKVIIERQKQIEYHLQQAKKIELIIKNL